jgi:hypothetical protein
LGSLGTGAGTRLYRDHLFLGENTGGPRDLFKKTALEELKKFQPNRIHDLKLWMAKWLSDLQQPIS